MSSLIVEVFECLQILFMRSYSTPHWMGELLYFAVIYSSLSQSFVEKLWDTWTADQENKNSSIKTVQNRTIANDMPLHK